jgi:O-antigen ligase
VIFDLIFEYIFGHNILGFKYPGGTKRLVSFSGEESNIGYYFFGFSLIFLLFVKHKVKSENLNLLIAIFLIFVSFVIGERANFIRTFLAISLFIFFVYEIKNSQKIIAFFILMISIFTFLYLNPNYKIRYYKQISLLFTKNGVSSYLNNSNYGAHRKVAIEIFKDNMIFGAGIKNFRIESASARYDDLNHKRNFERFSTHPHELYHEFLSETGIFGLVSFLIFIFSSIFVAFKNYFKSKNFYHLSSIIIICILILPVIPTGSFLSTNFSSIFWINYAIMMSFITQKNFKS